MSQTGCLASCRDQPDLTGNLGARKNRESIATAELHSSTGT